VRYKEPEEGNIQLSSCVSLGAKDLFQALFQALAESFALPLAAVFLPPPDVANAGTGQETGHWACGAAGGYDHGEMGRRVGGGWRGKC